MGISVLTNVTFLDHLGWPDAVVILLLILLLFGAKNLPDLKKGMEQAAREFWESSDELEPERMRATAQPPHLATPAFVYRLAWAFSILVFLILVFLFWRERGP